MLRDYLGTNSSIYDQNAPRLQTYNGFFPFRLSKKMHRGAALQTFFCFLPTKAPCQLERVSWIVEREHPNHAKRENNDCDRTLDFAC